MSSPQLLSLAVQQVHPGCLLLYLICPALQVCLQQPQHGFGLEPRLQPSLSVLPGRMMLLRAAVSNLGLCHV